MTETKLFEVQDEVHILLNGTGVEGKTKLNEPERNKLIVNVQLDTVSRSLKNDLYELLNDSGVEYDLKFTY